MIDVHVESVSGFIRYTLVRVPYLDKSLFFRISSIDRAGKVMRLRLERFTLYWQQRPVIIKGGSPLLHKPLQHRTYSCCFIGLASRTRSHELDVHMQAL